MVMRLHIVFPHLRDNLGAQLLLVASVAVISNSAAAIPPPALFANRNSAEQWVIDQVKAGQIADLSTHFQCPQDRKLRGRFVEDLLTGMLPNISIPRQGVQIVGAIIDDPIDLTNARILNSIWLQDCQFMSKVTFLHATCPQTMLFAGSTFKADANFSSMKVESDAFFQGTVFEEAAQFVTASIAGEFVANGAHFKNVNQAANFNEITVGSAFFEKAIFEGPVNFVGTQVSGTLQAQGAQFRNAERPANFNGIHVGRVAFFQEAIFAG